MIFFGVILIGLLILYFASYNSRDKTQDYKFKTDYNSLPSENRLIIDIHATIEKKVLTTLNLSTIKGTEGILMKGVINEYRNNMLNNLYDISRQYKLDPIFTSSIINRCCDDAIKEYLDII